MHFRSCFLSVVLSFCLPAMLGAQCPIDPSVDLREPESLYKLDFLGQKEVALLRQLNQIRTNPRQYAQSVLVPKMRQAKEDEYGAKINVYDLDRGGDRCDLKLKGVYNLSPEKHRTNTLNELLAKLEHLNRLKDLPPAIPCRMLCEIARDHARHVVSFLKQGQSWQQLFDYEFCHGKPTARYTFEHLQVEFARNEFYKDATPLEVLSAFEPYKFNDFAALYTAGIVQVGLACEPVDDRRVVWVLYYSKTVLEWSQISAVREKKL